MRNKAQILGGTVVKGDIVYEVSRSGVSPFRVVDIPVSDWSDEVFDVALSDGYTRMGGARRALCKTYEIATEYHRLLGSGKLQEFFNRLEGKK